MFLLKDEIELQHVLQLTDSSWTAEASTRERWQFRALD